jgi:hypothetical protein
MGFLDGLGRFIRGEDVFPSEEGQQPQASLPAQDTKPQQSPLVDERGYKVIPPVAIERLSARRNGDRVYASAYIANRSDRPVRIESFTIQGQKQVFNRDIDPNNGFQTKLYDGPVALSEHGEAELIFRIKENDDRFKNVYEVEFHREADGKFIIEELHEEGPVRDI